ncbi:hypothetical protein MCOR02_002902 [Pyricularia oryzae]|nr:hypothetical protein MCOR01_008685 [Pyricularia oryzae]KAH9439342.1 hypothetical protein MCOR02_002902 [Pyricularia oryzae]KAI6308322.1 hypothetical protein MCOR34_007254 [Pyricularia oryzae]KAI6337413.1 hypothetical protein MCOR28_008571 [Pyricularia oryzae]KAI6441381.1 hypothetical protein MCOR22_006580 [Pyricularia oryzae]
MVIMGLQLLLTAALSLCLGAIAQSCTSYGVDYSNGGSYYIDSSSNDYFSFVSEFQGCYRESISPVLIDPDNNQYACSAIEIGDSGAKVTSLCYIPFSAMRTGQWKLVLAGRQISTQRTINLKVGPLATTTVTATPTVIVGITSTPRAITIVSTIFKTETLVLPPKTTTRDCNIGQTQTVTVYPPTRTVTTQSIVTRTSTAGPVTKALTTTLVTTAKCHWPTSEFFEETRPPGNGCDYRYHGHCHSDNINSHLHQYHNSANADNHGDHLEDIHSNNHAASFDRLQQQQAWGYSDDYAGNCVRHHGDESRIHYYDGDGHSICGRQIQSVQLPAGELVDGMAAANFSK